MSSSEPSTTNVNLRKTPRKKKNRWSPPIMEITPQGSQSAFLLPAKVIVLFAFTVPFLRFFCWRVPFYWMFLFYVGIGIIQKKRDGWWLYWLLILHNSRIIYTKNQPLPFSKESLQDMYATAGHILAGTPTTIKNSSTAAAKSSKTKAATVTGQEARLSSLSLRSFHPPPLPISPSLARSLWPKWRRVSPMTELKHFTWI